MKDFRDLKVWEKAHALALHVYDLTARFPTEERYGLTSQMRRCAMSVPSNIAEGCARGSDADFARFLQIAMGSASEREYQLLFAHDAGLLTSADHKQSERDVVEVKQMLSALLKKLTADRYPSYAFARVFPQRYDAPGSTTICPAIAVRPSSIRKSIVSRLVRVISIGHVRSPSWIGVEMT